MYMEILECRKKHEDSFEETVENALLLQDAITRQLVSDVPLCTFYRVV